ncbi:MAG: glutaredoxin [Chthoniobacterales bacterium]|nr:glutaredoxin [Chthoniobacterales bacterium]
MMKQLPQLFVKTGCPWCHEAIEWLTAHEVAYDLIDVLQDVTAFEKMKQLSGQSKTPTLQMPDGGVLADFGVEELPVFLKNY